MSIWVQFYYCFLITIFIVTDMSIGRSQTTHEIVSNSFFAFSVDANRRIAFQNTIGVPERIIAKSTRWISRQSLLSLSMLRAVSIATLPFFFSLFLLSLRRLRERIAHSAGISLNARIAFGDMRLGIGVKWWQDKPIDECSSLFKIGRWFMLVYAAFERLLLRASWCVVYRRRQNTTNTANRAKRRYKIKRNGLKWNAAHIRLAMFESRNFSCFTTDDKCIASTAAAAD